MRNTNLDILRILAIFSVVLCHLSSLVPFLSNYCASWGKHGVELLLILSGYLAVRSLETQGTHGYYRRRIKRMIPLYWVVLSLELIYEMLFAVIYCGRTLKDFISSEGISFVRYFFCLQLVIPSDNWDLYNNRYALWTMSALAFFYLTVPVLYRVVKRYWSAQIVSIVLLILQRPMLHAIRDALSFLPESGHAEWFAEMTPISYMYCFFLGIVVYYAVKEKKEFFFSLVIVALMLYEPTARYRYEMIFSLVLMIACTSRIVIQKEKLTKHLVSLSTKCYAIYLVHAWAIKVCNSILSRFCGLDNSVARIVIMLVCIMCVSYGIYDFVQLGITKIERKV